jgi:riboflavin kinase / FMN adenylyltransferase
MTTVATIGTFDGVHVGHRWLLQHVADRANQLDASSAAVTFEPIPVSVLRPDVYRGRICSANEKIDLLRQSGVDHVDVIVFTRELAGRTAEEFLTDLHRRLDLQELWVGSDFALGRNRSGTAEVIASISEELGFSTTVVKRVQTGDRPISSTAIRQAIAEGDVRAAAQLLGRPFRLQGEVIHGAHLGRKIGYPTANFVPPPGITPIADGIYASYALLPGEIDLREAMTYVGTRPTVDGHDRQIETHILDFDGDLYGQVLTVDMVDRVRGDQTFDGLEPLIQQLKMDETAVREILQQTREKSPISFDRHRQSC